MTWSLKNNLYTCISGWIINERVKTEGCNESGRMDVLWWQCGGDVWHDLQMLKGLFILKEKKKMCATVFRYSKWHKEQNKKNVHLCLYGTHLYIQPCWFFKCVKKLCVLWYHQLVWKSTLVGLCVFFKICNANVLLNCQFTHKNFSLRV